MKKLLIVIALLSVAASPLAAQGQRVAMVLPPQLGGQPGYHTGALVRFWVGLARAGAASIDVYAPEEDREGLQELAGQLLEALALDTEITFPAEPEDGGYDKVIWLGGLSWYGLVHPDLPVEGKEGLLPLTEALAAKGGLLVAVGSGLIPLISAGLLPAGTEVAVYPCPDLIELCEEHGLVPVLPSGETCSDQSGRELPPAGFTLAQVGAKEFLSVAIPSSWFGPDESDSLFEGYGDAYRAAVDYLEQAWLGELAPGWSAEVAAACPELGPRPTPERALVIVFPYFHDQEFQGVTEFLDGEGVSWTVAAWQEAREATLRECSPPPFRGSQGEKIQPDTWAWCAKADDYDLLYIIGTTRIQGLFPCRGGAPSQAKARLFELIAEFLDRKKTRLRRRDRPGGAGGGGPGERGPHLHLRHHPPGGPDGLPHRPRGGGGEPARLHGGALPGRGLGRRGVRRGHRHPVLP